MNYFKSNEDVMDLMETFAEEYLADTGFFHSGPEASINVIKREEMFVSYICYINVYQRYYGCMYVLVVVTFFN